MTAVFASSGAVKSRSVYTPSAIGILDDNCIIFDRGGIVCAKH